MECWNSPRTGKIPKTELLEVGINGELEMTKNDIEKAVVSCQKFTSR